MKDIRHLTHVLAAFVLVTGAFLVIRSLVKPHSYGELGRYRADAVDEIKALPFRYAGKAAQPRCGACHKEQFQAKKGSSHRNIGCETCHGALAAHAEKPAGPKPRKPAESEVVAFCLRCHAKDPSKPPRFPTVDPRGHNPDTPCASCHPPHAPKL
ncbi:MAG TPA: hypothetical protein DCM05_14265 [Elusimicrobia bacterium]|nr:hypothetical protein [Elusimicrobiota bacterium]